MTAATDVLVDKLIEITDTGGEEAWCTLPRAFRRHMESCCKRLRDNEKLN